jgi:sodium-dependent dicarboxylate transporter 2/3/5
LYPVALSVLALARAGVPASAHRDGTYRNFAHALLLGVAYADYIGGMATMIGTPPYLFLVSYARATLGIEIGFAEWMMFGIPIMLLFLPATWWLLLKAFPVRGLTVHGVEGMADAALKEMGPLSRGEKATLVAFAFAAIAWVFRPFLTALTVGGVTPLAGLTDSGVAILAALFLFVFPAGGAKGPVLDWDTAKRVPFGLLLLFGGGLSLAAAIERNGVGEFLGRQMGALSALPAWAFVVIAAAGVLFLGELLSNTAMAATVIPICAAVAAASGWNVMSVLVPIALASSCGFMLPVATPPNAIAYGSGEIDARAMVRAGFWVNLIGLAIILGVMAALGRFIF